MYIMEHEYYQSRSQLKGYLFEIIIMELLRKNNFTKINTDIEPEDRVREERLGFIEFKGRGCWHQIDCPCDYSKFIPFSYPLRLLGEVKFYKSPLAKKYIREYIGVIKDIQENYFVADGVNPQDFYPRKMEIGVYFSANGFQAEAEKLAYAHGIKTVSYENNCLIDRLKILIEEFERNYLSVKCMKDDAWTEFRQDFIYMLQCGEPYYYPEYQPYFADGYREIIKMIRDTFLEIRSSFIATTATGVFIHFVGNDDFPEELFRNTDEGKCKVYYNNDNFGNRYFWMQIAGDDKQRKFYFTPPESLDMASVFGNETVLNEKERIFKTLNVNIMLNGISRSLTLHLDTDWLNAVRSNLRECNL